MSVSEPVMAVIWDSAAEAFAESRAAPPVPLENDLLVEVSAVSVNPVDLKVKKMIPPDEPARQLGYDACGRVVAVGSKVNEFAAGDRVFYAGSILRPGSNATHQLVDARIAAHAPETVDDADAASLPLTSLTAWEALFERLRIPLLGESGQDGEVLIINGAGGVGSVAIQLVRLAGLTPVATASRPQSQSWCMKKGAARVLPHSDLAELPDAAFGRILCCHDTDTYFDLMARLVAPMGIICAIVGARQPHELNQLFQKSALFGWEYMFTRSSYSTADIGRQGQILAEVARLVDAGELRPTRTRTLKGLSAETIAEAHRVMEDGSQIGKLVIAY